MVGGSETWGNVDEMVVLKETPTSLTTAMTVPTRSGLESRRKSRLLLKRFRSSLTS
jgi:hypothetical protein